MEPPLVDELEDRKEISFSKAFLLLYLLLGMVFVVGGVWLVVATPIEEGSFIFKHPVMVAALGWALIFFFGYFVLLILHKLLGKIPALIISKTGLTVNACGTAVGIGQILWSDVTDIAVYEDPKGLKVRFKWICLIVHNPDHYMDRQNNTKRLSTMCRTYKACGTPIAIGVSGLNISFDELLKTINEYYVMSQN
jgi:hypothetical protein